MQNYAYYKNRLLSAREAVKGINYFCPECRGIVRLRTGAIRQRHFFHLSKNSSCRLAQKGLIHLQLQHHIQKLFPGAILEKPFSKIGRIADVYHNQTVFEIQYSPMSLEEAKARCRDYESEGCQVIWILHDHTFGKRRLRPAEKFLRTKICYYSNMDKQGKGMIYDRLDPPFHFLHPRPLSLTKQKPLPEFRFPIPLQIRAKTWPCYHEGDFIDAALQGISLPTIQRKWKNPLKVLLQMLLERSAT